ncbi:MAG TPA: CoA transferase [Gemmatimonadaceae bacterium]|nr:CoA transferase [Gemmatimonadaceae bacterium]
MLNSIKILDLSRVLAGPLATMILGDLGAAVLKVEKPRTGDDTRGWGPPFDERGESAYYLSVNRNKKSIVLDIDEERDRAFLLNLAAGADVVIDNFRSGTLERRRIVPGEVLESNSRLIWCTITGFGEDSERIGYDLVVQAESGWMSITGDPGGEPMRVGVALADIIAGKDAAIAVLAALASRGLSAAPVPASERRIHISLVESARAALINVGQNSLVTGREARRWGNQHPNLVPYQLFQAADRAIVVGVGTDRQWQSFAAAAGLDELSADPHLDTNAGRLAQRDRIVAASAEKLRSRSAAHWIERFHRARVPAGIVKSVLESLREAAASPVTGIPPSVPGTVRLPPPRLDEHGAEIRTLGWRAFA